ncbi:MAG: hypothetical protein COZ21_11410 [Bacteroidetes bacterium CG_4_10_14_3_um_filter_31_20]|nr:MAG: hypothetical protein COZ21_11410 [Bacteroidetes bacterium CG_4_10_14_3_um_filter_31_20]
MRTTEIIKEIEQLPVQKRIFIIERTLKTLRQGDNKLKMQQAAEKLYTDYKTDNKLTEFTDIDFEEFYEAK